MRLWLEGAGGRCSRILSTKSSSQAQRIDPLTHLGNRSANRFLVKRHRLARVARQDRRLGWEIKEMPEGVVERLGSPSFLLGAGLKVGATDSVYEERISGEERSIVQQVTGVLRGVSRRA